MPCTCFLLFFIIIPLFSYQNYSFAGSLYSPFPYSKFHFLHFFIFQYSPFNHCYITFCCIKSLISDCSLQHVTFDRPLDNSSASSPPVSTSDSLMLVTRPLIRILIRPERRRHHGLVIDIMFMLFVLLCDKTLLTLSMVACSRSISSSVLAGA